MTQVLKHFADWDMVNQSKMFNNERGVNTNCCEGVWKHLKKTILHGTRREKIEEYVRLHNFKEWAKSHPDYDKLGVFGLLARVNNSFVFKDRSDAMQT